VVSAIDPLPQRTLAQANSALYAGDPPYVIGGP